MNALEFLLAKGGADLSTRSPIEIPGVDRGTLARWFAELGYTSGVEIGVEQGQYSRVLCKSNSGLKLYSVDPWKVYDGFMDPRTQEQLDTLYLDAVKRLSPYTAKIMRMTSVEAARKFTDNSLDFVYIDGNHTLPFVIQDLVAWYPKIKPGGIISGHDYYKSPRPHTDQHVCFAVNAYVDAYRIRPWFLLGRKNAPAGELRDRQRSWCFVKPLVV